MNTQPGTIAPPAGAAAAWTALESQIRSGITQPARIPVLVATLDGARQGEVIDKHWNVILAGCSGGQILAMGDLLNFRFAFKIKDALAANPPATTAELLPHFRNATVEDLKEAFEDAGLAAGIRAALPGSALAMTRLRFFGPTLDSPPLVRWLVETGSGPALLARIAGAMQKQEIAQAFDRGDLWSWLDQLEGGAALRYVEAEALRELARQTGKADVRTKIEALVAGAPDEADYERDPAELQRDRRDAYRELLGVVRGRGAVDAGALLALAARAGHRGKRIGGNVRYRRRLAAQLSADEVFQLVRSLGFELATAIDWLLEAGGPTSAQLPSLFSAASDVRELHRLFASARRVLRMRRTLTATNVISAEGGSTSLHDAAFGSRALRDWIFDDAQPLDLLWFAAFHGAARVRRACRMIEAAGIGYDWVYHLAAVGDHTMDIRRLALNIPDRAAARHLQNNVLRDAMSDYAVTSSARIPASAHEKPLDAVRRLADYDESSSGDLVATLAELGPGDRAVVAADERLLTAIFSTLSNDDPGRAAMMLDLSLLRLLRALSPRHLSRNASRIGFLSYVQGRPEAEQIAAASDAASTAVARRLSFLGSPLNLLPALATPANLSAALSRNPALIEWLLRGSAPTDVARALSSDPVARAAAAALESRTGLVELFPPSGQSRPALRRLRRHASRALARVIDQQLDAAPSAALEAQVETLEAAEGMSLSEGIARLSAAGADSRSFQALCNARPHSEALDLLSDPSQGERVATLAGEVMVSPLVCFRELPDPPPDAIFASPASIEWILRFELPNRALTLVAGTPAAATATAALIDRGGVDVDGWLAGLEDGFGLTPDEERALRRLFDHVGSDERAVELTGIRFGASLNPGWRRAELVTLWDTLSRLPQSHVEGSGLIEQIRRISAGPSTWSGSAGRVSLNTQGGGDARYKDQPWSGKSEIAARLGIDEAEVDRRVAEGRIETRTRAGRREYRIAETGSKSFSDTALHEIGHAVDDLLGGRTELVYDLAGWRRYSESDFDGWVSDMGGWQGASVSSADKAAIKDAFMHGMNGSRSIKWSTDLTSLVGARHPLMRRQNRGAFLVREAVSKGAKAFSSQEPSLKSGNAWFMNNYYQAWYTCNERAASVAPTSYALVSPHEFFAECYVEYYRGYDGTPATADRKGGNLPAWISDWFDRHVDTVSKDPSSTEG